MKAHVEVKKTIKELEGSFLEKVGVSKASATRLKNEIESFKIVERYLSTSPSADLKKSLKTINYILSV